MTAAADRLARDVQMYGALSAASVVARYAAKVEQAMASVVDEGWGPEAVASMVMFVRRSMQPLLDTGARPERVELPPVSAGETAVGALWLHNTAPVAAQGGVRLAVSDLVAAGGETIPASAISVSPQELESLPSRARRDIRLVVIVPVGQPAGWYHGWVFLESAPEAPVMVTLSVEETSR